MPVPDNRCPNCGRFIESEPNGFYDREWPYGETAQVLVFCDEQCADQQREKDTSKKQVAA